ncbi:MAG: hypothetical protein H8E73_06610 [Planctomycetes bacterium]|nr:hypothetical protein [Planctomycetota bacterium]
MPTRTDPGAHCLMTDTVDGWALGIDLNQAECDVCGNRIYIHRACENPECFEYENIVFCNHECYRG